MRFVLKKGFRLGFQSQSGMSLVELMVVTAIIGALTVVVTIESRKYLKKTYDAAAQEVAAHLRTAVLSNELPAFSLEVHTGAEPIFAGAASWQDITPCFDYTKYNKSFSMRAVLNQNLLEIYVGHCRGENWIYYTQTLGSQGNPANEMSLRHYDDGSQGQHWTGPSCA